VGPLDDKVGPNMGQTPLAWAHSPMQPDLRARRSIRAGPATDEYCSPRTYSQCEPSSSTAIPHSVSHSVSPMRAARPARVQMWSRCGPDVVRSEQMWGVGGVRGVQ